MSVLQFLQDLSIALFILRPRMLHLHPPNKFLMLRTSSLNPHIDFGWMADRTRQHLYLGLDDLSVLIDWSADIKDCKRLCDIDVNRCVCKQATRTDTATETEG